MSATAKDFERPTVPVVTENTVSFAETVVWQRDNQFILKYYRKQMTVAEALKSICVVHNETANIWTHVLAAFIFVILEIYSRFSISSTLDRAWLLTAYRFAAILCFSVSALFHSLICVSQSVCAWMASLDYSAILALLGIGGYCWIDIVFGNDFLWMVTYTMAGSILALIILFRIWTDPYFANSENRANRALYFGGYASCVIIPFVHGYFLKNDNRLVQELGLIIFVLLLGLMCYVWCIPERWSPGSFDLLPGHSIFHFLVFCGALLYHRKLRNMILFRALFGYNY